MTEKEDHHDTNRRHNQELRHALGGDEHILDETQRKSVLGTVKEAIQKFFHAGVSRAPENEISPPPVQKRFADRFRNSSHGRD